MTDKEKLEKVRAEIERRKKEVEDNIFELGNFESERIGLFDNKEIYNDLLSFIDSMQKEPKVCMYSTANYTNADRLTLCKDCEELCKYSQKTAAESLGISQEAYDEIVDKCLYGSEVELVDDGDLPKEEPVSEDLEEAVNAYIGYAPEIDESSSTYGKRQAFKAGAQWKEQQLMAKTVDAVVKIDAGGYPYIPQIELYDYDKDIPLAKEGDKYKVNFIKEI